MAFNQKEALAAFCAIMKGAKTKHIRFVLQGFVDLHAETTGSCMAIIPKHGYPKLGNHAWQDASRMLRAVGGANSPVCAISSNVHSGTIVASSDPEARFQQRKLPSGKFEIVMSMEVDHEISMATDAQSCEWIGGMSQSPFARTYQVKDFVPRCSHCIVSNACPVTPQRKVKACITTTPLKSTLQCPLDYSGNLLPAFCSTTTPLKSTLQCPFDYSGNLLPAFSEPWVDLIAPADSWIPVDTDFSLLPGFEMDDPAMFPAPRTPPPDDVVICTVMAAGCESPKRVADGFLACSSPKRAACGSPLRAAADAPSPKRAACAPRSPLKVLIPIRSLNSKHSL